MDKIFLSHSSKDKPYVSYIAEHIGKDKCVYDAMCFEAGMKNLDEIFREMGKTSIFVIFISENSLESDWVKKELAIADERLNHDPKKMLQIFPIIIDPSISHDDPRIPDFLKTGFGSYNLKVITSNIVAYRKIKTLQRKHILENNLMLQKTDNCFYGRDEEILNFKKTFDSREGIKVLVASGIMGIGRKSYLLQCLKQTELIEKYYTPPVISLNVFASIEDVIVKLSEIGFGNYSLETVTALPDMDRKIDALTSTFKCIQNYKEQVVIYDDGCLINRQGEMIYWLEKAIAPIRNEATILIASRYMVNIYCLRENSSIFAQSLSALPYLEWIGLMRVYAQNCQMELTQDDRSYFKDILTGYPPQIIYCVDMMKNTSVEEVKKNPRQIIEAFSPKVTEMLESVFPMEIKEDAYGLLAFASWYGIVPGDLLNIVLDIKENYKKSFSLFKALTICRYLGINNEYIEVNPVIADYIQRNRYDVPTDIKDILQKRLDKFNKSIEVAENTITEDFEDLKYYLKANIIADREIPERFMYSTLYLSSVYELYNNQKYKQVISLVEKLKEVRAFERYDCPIQTRIQEYYCRSLAREVDTKFYVEVEFFSQENESKNINEYNFLRGFMYRNNSEYDKALDRYKRVLEKQPKHRSAMREIVIVYRGLEDYESAYEYAKANYLRESDNLYQIQPYFEILIRKPKQTRTAEEQQVITEMLQTVKRINAIKPSTTYYEILGQFAAYEENDRNRSLAILNEGLKKFPESSYIIKSMFDCCEFTHDMQGMEKALEMMKPLAKESKATKVAYHFRQALYYAYQKKPKDFISNYINGIDGINDETKERLKRKVTRIIW